MDTIEPTVITEDCDHDWKFIDESFSHEFGTESAGYMECQLCGKDRAVEDGELDYDYDYDD